MENKISVEKGGEKYEIGKQAAKIGKREMNDK